MITIACEWIYHFIFFKGESSVTMTLFRDHIFIFPTANEQLYGAGYITRIWEILLLLHSTHGTNLKCVQMVRKIKSVKIFMKSSTSIEYFKVCRYVNGIARTVIGRGINTYKKLNLEWMDFFRFIYTSSWKYTIWEKTVFTCIVM